MGKLSSWKGHTWGDEGGSGASYCKENILKINGVKFIWSLDFQSLPWFGCGLYPKGLYVWSFIHTVLVMLWCFEIFKRHSQWKLVRSLGVLLSEGIKVILVGLWTISPKELFWEEQVWPLPLFLIPTSSCNHSLCYTLPIFWCHLPWSSHQTRTDTGAMLLNLQNCKSNKLFFPKIPHLRYLVTQENSLIYPLI